MPFHKRVDKRLLEIIDSVTLMGRTHKQIPAERKERLKPVLNEDIRKLSDKETSDSKYGRKNGKQERS